MSNGNCMHICGRFCLKMSILDKKTYPLKYKMRRNHRKIASHFIKIASHFIKCPFLRKSVLILTCDFYKSPKHYFQLTTPYLH